MHRNIVRTGTWLTAVLMLACASPDRIELTPEDAVLDRAGETVLLQAAVFDKDGQEMSARGLELTWQSDDDDIATVTKDGVVTAVMSGGADITAAIAETDVKAKVTVRVKIPSAVQVSKEKLRLDVGQTEEDIWAVVNTERGGFIKDLKPTWSTENSSIVKVEPVNDPNRPRSYARLTGVAPGVTHVTARYENFSKTIRVNVFGEGEEVQMVGVGISAKKARDARKGKKKKEKALKYDF